MTWFHEYMGRLDWWEAVGWCGQTLFFSRFLIQWLASERKGRSVVPFHFWTLSIVGSLVLLVYLFHVYVTEGKNMPLIAGQIIGLLIYGRNMTLIKNGAKEADEPENA